MLEHVLPHLEGGDDELGEDGLGVEVVSTDFEERIS
jgi:hypothetical protein